MTPTKAFKAGVALMMQSPANDDAWVTRCQATTERLKAKEAVAKAGASAQEGAEVGDAAQEPGLVKTTPGATRLDGSGSGRQESGSTNGTPKTVEDGKAETSACNVGQADVKETKEVVETPQDAGKEEE
jgi:hypothetical protein